METTAYKIISDEDEQKLIENFLENKLRESITILRELFENGGRLSFIVSTTLDNSNNFQKQIEFIPQVDGSLKNFEKAIILDAFHEYIEQRENKNKLLREIEQSKENVLTMIDMISSTDIDYETYVKEQLEKIVKLASTLSRDY